ncbi:MAG: phosphatidylglycerophosphatase A [Alphaproteobacteria bacterium]|nr:phosphatidylglycerophosphatase A [Alphaproteobacteria bacterium]
MKAARFHPATILATWFWVGFIPPAPGTWGSVAALPLAWLVQTFAGPGALLLLCVVLAVVGVWAAGHHCTRVETHDPGEIVIDEVAGQCIACLLLPPGPWWLWLAAFVLFRMLDIFKPWPISLLDRSGRGGMRVMQDDLAAGLLVCVVMQLYLHMAGAAWIP